MSGWPLRAAWLLAIPAAIGGAALVRHADAPQAAPAAAAAPAPTPALDARTAAVLRGLDRLYYQPGSPGHLKPTQGAAGPAFGLVGDYGTTIWMAQQMVLPMWAEWTLTGSADLKHKLADNAEWLWSRTDEGKNFGGDGLTPIRTVAISDDGAWKAMFAMVAHDVTGDPKWLDAIEGMIPALLARYRDRSPGNPVIDHGITVNGVRFQSNAAGMLYAADPDSLRQYGKISTVFEAYLAIAAYYAWQHGADPAYRRYALATWDWIFRRLRTTEENGEDAVTGLYYCDLILDPASPDYLKPKNAFYGNPKRSVAAEYDGGTLAMAVLSAMLARDPRLSAAERERHRAEAQHIIAVFPDLRGFGRTLPDGKPGLGNLRDPFTNGAPYGMVVDRVLTLPGVDADGRFKAALVNTADYMLANDIARDGTIGADWSGPERNVGGRGTMTWAQDARFERGNLGQADGRQIMTSGSGRSILIAAAAVRGR